MPLDLTKPVQTRDGRPVRILCTDRRHSVDTIVALVVRGDAYEAVVTYAADGSYGIAPSAEDLINVAERICGWVNLYPPGVASSRSAYVNGVYATREEADGGAGIDRIGVAYIDTERLA